MIPAPRQDSPAFPSRVAGAYLLAHFPDVIRTATDFRDPGVVIDGARRCLGGGRADRALDLLEIAIDHCPEVEALWLARLEVLHFSGARPEFLDVVREFLEVHPESSNFGEIVQFWKCLAPT